MITGGDLRQSRLDVGYKTFTISPCSSGIEKYKDISQQYGTAKQELSNHIRSWDNLVPKSEIGESGYLKQVGWH